MAEHIRLGQSLLFHYCCSGVSAGAGTGLLGAQETIQVTIGVYGGGDEGRTREAT